MGLFKDCGCGCNGKKQEEKLIISIISGLTFFMLRTPRLSVSSGESWVQDRNPYWLPLYFGSPCAHARVHSRRLGYDEHEKESGGA